MLELGPVRAADHEHDVAAALAALLQPAGEGLRRVLAPARVQQRDVGPLRDPALDLLVLADLDQGHARVPREQPLVVLDIVRERGPHLADREHGVLHRCDTRRAWTTTLQSGTSTSTRRRR